MYSIPCRILCWVLVYLQLISCQVKPDATRQTAVQAAASLSQASFCTKPSTPLNLAPPAPNVTWAATGDGTNSITFTFNTSSYDESYFTWNICPGSMPLLDTYQWVDGKAFSPSCSFPQNFTTSYHTLTTNLLTVPQGYFYFASCTQSGVCKNMERVEVTNLPGPNIPTAQDIQNQQENYNFYIRLAEKIQPDIRKLRDHASTSQLQAMYDQLLAISIPELADILQTQEWSTSVAEFSSIDPSKFTLAPSAETAAQNSCDFTSILSLLENGVTVSTTTETQSEIAALIAPTTVTVTETQWVENTDTVAATSAGSGGSSSNAWIGKGFAIAGALFGVIYSGYNLALSVKSYRLNRQVLLDVTSMYKHVSGIPSLGEVQEYWGEGRKAKLTVDQIKLLSPKLAEFRAKTIDPLLYDKDGIIRESKALKPEALNSFKSSIADISKPPIKAWGIATAAGVLVLVTTVVLSSFFQLANYGGEFHLDSTLDEMLKGPPHPTMNQQ